VFISGCRAFSVLALLAGWQEGILPVTN